MYTFLKKLLTTQLFLLLLSFFALGFPGRVSAADPEILASDIDQFFQAGAQGYLVWQYGGYQNPDNGRQIAVDQFSFYRDTNLDICEVLKTKSDEYSSSGKFIGVNINNIGAAEFTDGTATEHMTWLREKCGVSKIRIFAKVEGVDGVMNALNAASAAGVQIIVAIGDYSNGGGGVPQGAGKFWYESGYKGEYTILARSIANKVAGNPALFGIELANEAHCGGDASAIDAYKAWGADIGKILAPASGNIGYGQMAGQNTTRCDSPGPGDFKETNSIPEITMTSAHYYTEEEKQNAFAALSISQGLGKMFYIGEAPPGGLSESSEEDQASGYDTSQYPLYNIINQLFYYTPIMNITKEDLTPDVLTTELASSGYEAYCVDENLAVKPEYNTQDLINTFLKHFPLGIALEAESLISSSTQNARYPVWRDVSNKQHLFASLEEYFGFKDVYETRPSDAILQSAPINSLLSQKQMCVQGWKNLVAQKQMCRKLTDEANCAMLARPVPPLETNADPGSGLTIDQLYTKLADYAAAYNHPIESGTENAGCEELMSMSEDDAGFTKEIKELQAAIVNVPTYFDRAYRYGFIVTVIKTQQPGKITNGFADRFFNFFTPSTQENGLDEVLVTAFKLPDIGTNKGGLNEGESASKFWNDPLDLTRQLLTTKQQQFYHESVSRQTDQVDAQGNPQTEGTSRTEVRTNAVTNSLNAAEQSEGSKIYCMEGAWDGPGPKSVSCTNPMTKALTDVINGTVKGCGGTFEQTKKIFDVASFGDLTNTTGKIFDEETGRFNLAILLEGSEYNPDAGGITDLQNARTETKSSPAQRIRSIFSIERDKSPEVGQTEISYYIVYPKGFEVDEVNDVLQATFLSKEQIAQVQQSGITQDGFEMKGVQQGLNTGSTGHQFSYFDPEEDCGETPKIDPVTGDVVIDPKTGEIVKTDLDCEKSFSINIEAESPSGIGIVGAKLGRTLRNIQTALNPKKSKAAAYIASCKTMEEFLLGRCTGGNIGSGGSENGSSEGNGSCTPLTEGYCSPEYLQPFFEEAGGFENPAQEAINASMICSKESGGNPSSFNPGCLVGKSVDYSVGLFQINMLAQCQAGFADGAGQPGALANGEPNPQYDPYLLPCTIVDQELVNSCANNKLVVDEKVQAITGLPLDDATTEKEKADANIRVMVQLRKSRGSWGAWLNAAKMCGLPTTRS